jgi:hypothetical protein
VRNGSFEIPASIFIDGNASFVITRQALQ